MNETTPIERVVMDVEATAAEVAEVKEAFRQAGFDVAVRPSYERKSADVLPWIVYVTLAAPIATFFTTLAAKAADDAYPAIKRWVKSVWNARRGRDGSIVLRDPDGSYLILGTRIPDEAIEALAHLDWSRKLGQYLIWDEGRGEWQDQLR
jgi:hypothetical protein